MIALTCLALTAGGGGDDNASPAASAGGSGTSNNGGSGTGGSGTDGSGGSGGSTLTWRYDVQTPAADGPSFPALLDSEGAKGYRAKGGQVFGSTTSWICMTDQTQSPAFTYQSAATQSTGANFVQQANDFGA
ncbi:hypothetical protein [Burkholderia ambifaria]|uniref:Uncharacterized protein n=1 Tax=Burkholderia ambifaria MEX-5 TaxID=396597 RepID=B1TBC7_9BURK|nr:conserved hypothetical protein [Burkholderia ambifaria MEX-5]